MTQIQIDKMNDYLARGLKEPLVQDVIDNGFYAIGKYQRSHGETPDRVYYGPITYEMVMQTFMADIATKCSEI